jgi:hypothetical protein
VADDIVGRSDQTLLANSEGLVMTRKRRLLR